MKPVQEQQDKAGSMTAAGDERSYVDYETFLDPGFSPSSFANRLVLATNNSDDATLDLSTPLSTVLFDMQEVDSHIDLLTRRSALPLLRYTQQQTEASGRIVGELEPQIRALNDCYRQLEKEVIQKHAEADEVRQVATRLWDALRLGRTVGRCLQLGRQLSAQHADLTAPTGSRRKEDDRALVRCTHTLLDLDELLPSKPNAGCQDDRLARVKAVRALQTTILKPVERSVRDRAERIMREFSLASASSSATFAQSEEMKDRTVSALTTLYLLSLPSPDGGDQQAPALMLHALELYLGSALQSSIASVGRALAALPTLDRALAEAAARCQNVVALEAILESTKVPLHPLPLAAASELACTPERAHLLQPVLAHLETSSLPSYFWRTMASSLSKHVQTIVARGGISARTLRSNKTAVADSIRDCVLKGSRFPSAAAAKGKARLEGDHEKRWEREVAVMVGSVLGHLER